MVEFAIVGPIALMILFGLISGSWLFFQHEAVSDGARAGARAASIETSLYQQSGGSGPYCESGAPGMIASAVAAAAPNMPVNRAALCAPAGSTTHLQQQPSGSGLAAITVDASPSLAAPTSVQVTVTYSAKGMAPPFTHTFNFSSSSAQPVLQP